MWSSNSTSGYTSQNNERKNRKVYSTFQSSSSHNSQRQNQLKCLSIVNKQNVAHTYNGISLSPTKDQNSDMCYNTDEP